MKISHIISHLSNLSNQEREATLCELLNHFCVGCGAQGDFINSTCPCEPQMEEVKDNVVQLFLPLSQAG